MLKYRLRQAEGERVWECPKGMDPILHRLLSTRGVSSDEEARRYLNPGRELFHDPFLLSDMDEAVQMIRQSIRARERVCVYGDYDVDGVCASAILSLYLKSRGVDCDVYLPSRHTEGYGLNADAVDKIAKDFQLLITVDCGITALELVERAKEHRLKVIVTDHHRPGDQLPDCPTVNPLLSGYPFGYLCGAGVAFQLVAALEDRDAAMEYIDLAALATIADIVPLRDENRAIASLGLKRINHLTPRPGVRALIAVSGLEGRVLSAGNVAFQLTPRMNASGRMGDARRAYDMMTSNDYDKCLTLAKELDEENNRRRALENEALEEAEKQLEGFDFASHAILIVQGESWNPGVIGLAASRLTEKYHFPSIALTRDGDSFTGSCRSIEGVNIHEALTQVADLMERFGGHEMAAGLKLKSENLPEFKHRIDQWLLENHERDKWIPQQEYDWEIKGRELTSELVTEMEKLAPTGCQNPGAVFLCEGDVSEAYGVGREKEHLKLTMALSDGMRLPGIWFRHAQDASRLKGRARMLFVPGINEYMGVRSVQAEVRQLFPLAQAQTGSDALRAAYWLKVLRSYKASEKAERVSLSALAKRMQENIMGTLVECADWESARALTCLSGPERADVLHGEYPADPRGFNAICVCPLGQSPAFYPYRACAGLPAELCGDAAQVEDAILCKALTKCPDVDGLRDIFKAARALGYARFPDEGEACRALASALKMDLDACALGLGVLEHMGLIRLETRESRISIACESRKASPEEDELYRFLTRLRG